MGKGSLTVRRGEELLYGIQQPEDVIRGARHQVRPAALFGKEEKGTVKSTTHSRGRVVLLLAGQSWTGATTGYLRISSN